jgi:hypothetical protein
LILLSNIQINEYSRVRSISNKGTGLCLGRKVDAKHCDKKYSNYHGVDRESF